MAAYGNSNVAETSGANSQSQDANKFSISSRTAATLGQIKVATLCQIQGTWSNQNSSTLLSLQDFAFHSLHFSSK